MYLRILKKDIKRKKTMNLILLVFVVLAVTFMASSAKNLVTVSSALDSYFEKADVPDHWFITAHSADVEAFEKFAGEGGYDYYISRLLQIDPKEIFVEGEKLDYSHTLFLSTLGGTKVFDKNNEELTEIHDGEIYVTNLIFELPGNHFREGGKIVVKQGEMEKQFTIKGYMKDALFGSPMIGMTRFLISDHDAALFDRQGAAVYSSVEVRTKDAGYQEQFKALGINTVMAQDRSQADMLYYMDMLIAAILLVVSVCLIFISMVILRFVIHFTITEEYREIGVMKAIGIASGAIRGLYIVKYLAISIIGTAAGLGLSVPFGKLMLDGVSDKIIISGEEDIWINIGAAILAGMTVVLFSYFCTRRIRVFSPIDAIRSGETGERFRRKSILHLGKSRMPEVLFMACNDIFSGMKSYVSMIVIFILGTLLVIIPVNSINTLCSDNLNTLFNMAESDHVISQELFFYPNEDNEAKIEKQFSEIKEMFSEKGIAVDVFQEVLFLSNVSRGDQLSDSISFKGCGDVTADQYAYMEGTPPQNVNEVALSYITAERIGAEIGDDVNIKVGETTKTYTVTAINQSMNNLGESVRFHPKVEFDYAYAAASFGIQVSYRDHPGEAELARRKMLLQNLYSDATVYTQGEYINFMIGDAAGQLDSMKTLILAIVLSINTLVAALMVKSFIAKEKREIALLKAIGFTNHSLVSIQVLRIGIVLFVSVLVGALISSPMSTLMITPVFRMMGAYSIEFEIRAVEVYVVFPLIMLAATAFGAFVSAQGLRKISSSEISGIE